MSARAWRRAGGDAFPKRKLPGCIPRLVGVVEAREPRWNRSAGCVITEGALLPRRLLGTPLQSSTAAGAAVQKARGGAGSAVLPLPACLVASGGCTGCGALPDEAVLTKGFWLGKYGVRQRHWRAVMGSNPSYFKNCGPDCPVENCHPRW